MVRGNLCSILKYFIQILTIVVYYSLRKDFQEFVFNQLNEMYRYFIKNNSVNLTFYRFPKKKLVF